MKIVSENRFSGKTYFYTIASSHLHLKHGFSGEGEASSLISGLYFNRALSSWEPFLDPWKCACDWRLRRIGAANGQKLSLNMVATDVVNFTLTSTLVELYQMVKANWTEDYYNSQGPQGGDDAQQGLYSALSLVSWQ